MVRCKEFEKSQIRILVTTVGDTVLSFSLSLFSFHCDLFSSFFLLSFFSFRTSFRLCVIDSHDDYYCVYIFSIYIHVVFPLLGCYIVSVVFVLFCFSFLLLCSSIKILNSHTHTRTSCYTNTNTSELSFSQKLLP